MFNDAGTISCKKKPSLFVSNLARETKVQTRHRWLAEWGLNGSMVCKNVRTLSIGQEIH